MLAILKREIGSYFTSPIGYVFVAVCMLTSGLFFYINSLSAGSTDLSSVFVIMFFILMIFIPVLTMRLMSEEKRQKTDQLVLTAPVGLFGLVTGKFLSAFTVYLIGIAVLPVYGVVLSFFVHISWMTLWGNVAGIILLGGVYVSLGLLISTMTENQMIAAVGSMFLNLVIFLLDALSSIIPFKILSDAFKGISVYNRYIEFTMGIFTLSNVLFFVTFIAVLLFLTARVIERRRWA